MEGQFDDDFDKEMEEAISQMDFEELTRECDAEEAVSEAASADPVSEVEKEAGMDSGNESDSSASDTADSDLYEGFSEAEKQAFEDEREWRKKWADIEHEMHTVDFSKRDRFRMRASPFILKVQRLMAEELGISPGELYEHAIWMFYLNFFTPQKKVVADLSLALDSFSLAVNELTLEANHLSNLAEAALNAESHPNYVIGEEIEREDQNR